MTVAVFTLSLLGTMALGTPIAFALLVCALALMVAQGQMDATALSQTPMEGADGFPLLAIPFLVFGELKRIRGN
jgi:TRAP-type transport system large permease protein